MVRSGFQKVRRRRCQVRTPLGPRQSRRNPNQVPRQNRHGARRTQTDHPSSAPPLRSYHPPARGERTLRLQRQAHPATGPGPLRAPQSPHLPPHRLALSAFRQPADREKSPRRDGRPVACPARPQGAGQRLGQTDPAYLQQRQSQRPPRHHPDRCQPGQTRRIRNEALRPRGAPLHRCVLPGSQIRGDQTDHHSRRRKFQNRGQNSP